MEKGNDKVAVVVVTFNRLELLKECIDALRRQTYPNLEIIVVNNGSTDGTKEYLDEQTDLTVIHQENCGGAGGFYTGMKHMMEQTDADWLLLMDDDGIPDRDQVKHLVEYCSKNDVKVANALVVDRNDHAQLVAKVDAIEYPHNLKDFYPDIMFPFNGTMFAREVIDKIGYIKKEMFIWGDEREYMLRVKANGFRYGIVSAARHYHPQFKGEAVKILPFMNRSVVIKPEGRDKYFYRNLGYIDATYGRHNNLHYWIYYLSRGKFKALKRFMHFYMMGYKNNYVEI